MFLWRPIARSLMCALGLVLLAPVGGAATFAAPAIFAPGVISGPADDSDPAFLPDGHTVIFGRNGVLMMSHWRGKQWSAPVIAPFSGRWNDQQPALAPDGSHLVFVSNRPALKDGTPLAGGRLWRVEYRDRRWSAPTLLPATVNRSSSIWAPSIAADGSLYFIDRPAPGRPFRIWRAQRQQGTYLAALPQSFGNPDTQDVDPVVAPDESFIVFSSMLPVPNAHEKLFIAFRSGEQWGAPIDFGPVVNGDGSTDVNEARLSPDGRTLYFSTDRMEKRAFPRSREQTGRDLQRMQSWDNGRQNIWSISLVPWLDKAARP